MVNHQEIVSRRLEQIDTKLEWPREGPLLETDSNKCQRPKTGPLFESPPRPLLKTDPWAEAPTRSVLSEHSNQLNCLNSVASLCMGI